jgi:Tfp pilus assembly protein PilF
MVEDNPISCRARLGFGFVADRSGLSRVAITHYRRGIQLCPNDPRLHANVGAAYQKIKMLDPAKHSYDEARRLQPRSPSVWNNFGFLYIEMGEFAQSFRALQNARQFSAGRDPAVYANLGLLHEIQGQYGQALTAYQRGLQLVPLDGFFRQKVDAMRGKVAQSTDLSDMP